MLRKYFHSLISLTLLVLFLFTCFNSLRKYNEKLTTISFREVHQGLQQYPSITVCPLMAMKARPENKALFLALLDKNSSVPPSADDMANTLRNVLKNINDTFYFVNQKSLSNPGFPCMTKMNSYDIGKPCKFPYKIK